MSTIKKVYSFVFRKYSINIFNTDKYSIKTIKSISKEDIEPYLNEVKVGRNEFLIFKGKDGHIQFFGIDVMSVRTFLTRKLYNHP